MWVDLDDIIPSAPWMAEIRTAITEADAVVFVITPDSVTSEVCRIEFDCAVEAPKRLVPIIARETPNGTVPLALAELNWLPFLDGRPPADRHPDRPHQLRQRGGVQP